MAWVIGGVEYVKTSEVYDRLAPDVGPETLRNWTRPRPVRGRVDPPLVVPLADAAGRRVRLDGELVVPWPQVVEAEYRTRSAKVGRRRAGNPRTA